MSTQIPLKRTKRILFAATLMLTLFGLSACDDDYVAYDESIEIIRFDMLDSYGTNTEFDYDTPLALNPKIDDGFFELFWSVERYGPDNHYRRSVYVNDRPTITGAILLSSWVGGPEYTHCYYTTDFYLDCESAFTPIRTISTDISPLIYDVPQKLYFLLKARDPDTGDYDEAWRSVVFE